MRLGSFVGRTSRARLSRVGALAVLLGTGLVFVPACADDESSLFVRAVMVESADTCAVTADPTAPMRGQGALDAKYAPEYVATLLVGNQVVKRGDSARLRTETSRITLYEAEVSVLDASGGTIAQYTVPTSGFVDPGNGSDAGYGLADVVMIDAATAKNLGQSATSTGFVQNVVSSVIIHGRTLGGSELQTREFQFPISICYGCLCVIPPAADDPATPGVDCNLTDTMPDPNCRIGMDRPVDCRLVGGKC